MLAQRDQMHRMPIVGFPGSQWWLTHQTEPQKSLEEIAARPKSSAMYADFFFAVADIREFRPPEKPQWISRP